MTNELIEVDWGAGVKLSDNPTAEGLERSAILANESAERCADVPSLAEEWRQTAARLRAKAAALRARQTGEVHD